MRPSTFKPHLFLLQFLPPCSPMCQLHYSFKGGFITPVSGTAQGTGDSGRPWSLPLRHSATASQMNGSLGYVLLEALLALSFHSNKLLFILQNPTQIPPLRSLLPHSPNHQDTPCTLQWFCHMSVNTSVLQGPQCQDCVVFTFDSSPPHPAGTQR